MGTGSNDSITLHLSVIPEPHSAALLLAGLASVLAVRRKVLGARGGPPVG